jgi:hypothetical protein
MIEVNLSASVDQNKGPMHGVFLPAEIRIGLTGLVQCVPRRAELQKVREHVGDRTVGALEVAIWTIEEFQNLINRSDADISPCRQCGQMVVCIGDGLAICKDCIKNAVGA